MHMIKCVSKTDKVLINGNFRSSVYLVAVAKIRIERGGLVAVIARRWVLRPHGPRECTGHRAPRLCCRCYR